jgi:hypothetical protein
MDRTRLTQEMGKIVGLEYVVSDPGARVHHVVLRHQDAHLRLDDLARVLVVADGAAENVGGGR